MEEVEYSIIVPIYNVEKYLEKCVDTLINQTYSNIEIILVDDGSTDNSPQICDMYEKEDPRIVVLHKENGGLSDARNKGMEIAKGKYIMFVDSDDYVEKDICERLLPYVYEEYDIIVCDAIVEGGNVGLSHCSLVKEKCTGKEFLKISHKENKAPMAAWLNVYRTNFLKKFELNFKYGILHEDEQFTPRAFLKADKMIYSAELFYHYILHQGTITTKPDKRKNMEDLYDTCCELERLYNQLVDEELKTLLKDSLVIKYLNLFYVGNLYRYGNVYVKKDFLLRNANRKKTKFKTKIFCLSPRVYHQLNFIEKNCREFVRKCKVMYSS